MALRSKTSIFNAALLRCGREDTETGGSGDLWRAMDANYDEIVRQAFEDGDGVYTFGRGRETLTSRTAGNYKQFDDSYTLPSDCLHVTEVYFDDDPAADLLEAWDVIDDQLLVDADGRTIEIEYVKAGAEANWSALFAKAIQRRLEAVIKSFMEEEEEAQVRDQEADMLLLKAGLKASKSRGQHRVWKRGGGRLIRARRRRSRLRSYV